MKKPAALGMSFVAHGGKCLHCGRAVRQAYMVHDPVWTKAGAGIDHVLHIGCVEKRIGRRLTKRDFYYGAEYRS